MKDRRIVRWTSHFLQGTRNTWLVGLYLGVSQSIGLHMLKIWADLSWLDICLQCDAIRWEQFEILHFSIGYNFCTKNLILILKTPILVQIRT